MQEAGGRSQEKTQGMQEGGVRRQEAGKDIRKADVWPN
jgi:hypothetical protein